MGSPLPMDAFQLADAYDVIARPWWKGGGARDGRVVRYPMRARHVYQQYVVFHECAHVFAEDHGLNTFDERLVHYFGVALSLPREPFLRDADETNLDLFAIQERHPNVGLGPTAQRLTHLAPVTVSVWDAGKLHRRYVGEGAESIVDHDGDAELVDRVLEIGQPVKGSAESAWPAFDGIWRRVLVVRRVA